MPRAFQVFLNDGDAEQLEAAFKESGFKTKQEFLERLIQQFLQERNGAPQGDDD